MIDRNRIVGLLTLGWSVRRVARETQHRPETVARYGRAAGVLAVKPSTPPKVPTDPAASRTAEKAAVVERGPSRSVCEPHRAFVAAEVEKGRNAVAIYQDLVEHHGYCGAYDAVKRFVRKLVPRELKVSCRFETAPGQEAQVDYGEGAPTRDARTGKYRKPRLFVMTLGMSRHAFRKSVARSSQQTWCELHEEAFAYFGGAPKTIRLDNLREGVVDPDVYDPEVNRLYAAMLAHYGVVALPCRPYAPDLKGKVESAVGHTQATALKGRQFETLAEQNVFLRNWNERWAATRIHGTTKRQVREMFEEERPTLLPLPPTRFEYYRILERRVHFDGHVEVDGAYYSAPPRYVGGKVVVHAGRLWLRVLDPQTQQCVREHVIAASKGARRTAEADRPKQTPPHVHRLIEHIAAAGPSCGAFAEALEAERGALALRALFGVIDLLRRHDVAQVERACALALTAGTVRLRFLRTYLGAHGPASPLTGEHRLIETISTYRSHFVTLTQEELFNDQR